MSDQRMLILSTSFVAQPDDEEEPSVAAASAASGWKLYQPGGLASASETMSISTSQPSLTSRTCCDHAKLELCQKVRIYQRQGLLLLHLLLRRNRKALIRNFARKWRLVSVTSSTLLGPASTFKEPFCQKRSKLRPKRGILPPRRLDLLCQRPSRRSSLRLPQMRSGVQHRLTSKFQMRLGSRWRTSGLTRMRVGSTWAMRVLLWLLPPPLRRRPLLALPVHNWRLRSRSNVQLTRHLMPEDPSDLMVRGHHTDQVDLDLLGQARQVWDPTMLVHFVQLIGRRNSNCRG